MLYFRSAIFMSQLNQACVCFNGVTMAGKGSKPRPIQVDRKQFDDNWDRIFKKEKDKDVRVQMQDSKNSRR